MRSRTELVTTTFIDSEDDFTETDDSEEDWRPSASNRNGKKRAHTTKGRNRGNCKRKYSGNSSSGTHKKKRRQAAQDAIYQTFDDSDDEDEYDYEYYKARTQFAAEVEPKAMILPPKKKQNNNNSSSGVFELFLYRKDLKEDYLTNSHLCLWRKDGSNLLQKYIRVKTGIPEEFIFTSSSVYSTWDEKRRRDFVNIAVKCLAENHRRVTFVNTADLHLWARTELERCFTGLESVTNDVDDENGVDADVEPEMEGSDQDSDVSDCDDNGSLHPQEEDEPEIECDEDNMGEMEGEQIFEEEQVEEEYEPLLLIEEEDEEEAEEDNNDDERNGNDSD